MSEQLTITPEKQAAIDAARALDRAREALEAAKAEVARHEELVRLAEKDVRRTAAAAKGVA